VARDPSCFVLRDVGQETKTGILIIRAQIVFSYMLTGLRPPGNVAMSVEEALNSAVRTELTQGKPRRRPFVQKSWSLGSDQNFRWDKALEAATAMEDEEFSRKFSLRK
jgi:hypothetical protein